MAHYATKCWNAEIECVGIPDRSTYELCAHTVRVQLNSYIERFLYYTGMENFIDFLRMCPYRYFFNARMSIFDEVIAANTCCVSLDD